MEINNDNRNKIMAWIVGRISSFLELSCQDLIIILVHWSGGISGLGATSPLGHDDLVHSEYRAGSVGGVLHGPLLAQQQIKHTRLTTVLNGNIIVEIT